jgi:peptide/nickel transport system permease protein
MSAVDRFVSNRAACVGALILIVFVALAFAAPCFFPQDPWEMVGAPSQPPLSTGFLLGTDMLGRDIAACIAYGARVTLLLAIATTLAATAVGALVGACAGYYGGIVDTVMMRATEFIQTVPSFLMAVVLVTLFTPTLTSIIAVIVIVSWPPVARLVRGQFLYLRSAEYVRAAELLGESTFRIILRQILPNAFGPIVVAASLTVGTAILMEASLSFLGLGDPDLMSLGYLVGATRNLVRDFWWMCTLPGLAIFLTVLALNLVGDGLSDALNPRLNA